MTSEEILNIENRIINYNKKRRYGSTGAMLLHRAWELIEHYKESNKMAYEQSNFLEDRVIKVEAENAELRGGVRNAIRLNRGDIEARLRLLLKEI